MFFFTLPVPIPDKEKKLKAFINTFWGTTKEREHKKLNLFFISMQFPEMHRMLRVNNGFEKNVIRVVCSSKTQDTKWHFWCLAFKSQRYAFEFWHSKKKFFSKVYFFIPTTTDKSWNKPVQEKIQWCRRPTLTLLLKEWNGGNEFKIPETWMVLAREKKRLVLSLVKSCNISPLLSTLH